MAVPGFVVNPDGSKGFVQDTWTYFLKHPESYQSTLDEKNKINATEATRVHRTGIETTTRYAYCCVGGIVLKDCRSCSYNMYHDYALCKDCKGQKFVKERCAKCNPLPEDPVAAALVKED